MTWVSLVVSQLDNTQGVEESRRCSPLHLQIALNALEPYDNARAYAGWWLEGFFLVQQLC